MAKLDTYINIDVNGNAAVAGLGKVERAARDVDTEIDDIGGQGDEKMSLLASGTDALAGKMRDLAGPAAVGAVVTGMVAAVEKTIELGVQADTIATALDITTEEASRLAAAFGDVGIEANDIVDIGLQIQGGLEDNTDLTDRLGVVMDDLKSPVDAIRVGIDNWDLLTPTERATLFGEEGVRQISRMVAEGQTLDEILAGVSDIRVISEDDAERARKMAASMAELKGLVEGITLTVGGNLLEAFENVQAVADLLPGDLEAATIAAELFAAALSPPLTILGKIDDAVNLVAETFAGELDPAAQTVANSVLRAFEETEQGADDLGTAGAAAIREIETAYDQLRGKLDDRNAWLNLQDTIDEVKRKHEAAEAAAVEGADSRRSRQPRLGTIRQRPHRRNPRLPHPSPRNPRRTRHRTRTLIRRQNPRRNRSRTRTPHTSTHHPCPVQRPRNPPVRRSPHRLQQCDKQRHHQRVTYPVR